MKTRRIFFLLLALLAGGRLWAQDGTIVPDSIPVANAGNTSAGTAGTATGGNTTPPLTSQQLAQQRQASAKARADAAAAAAAKRRAAAVAHMEELAKLPKLKENMTLTVKAELTPGLPMELSLTGIGPEFKTTTLLPDPSAAKAGNSAITDFYAVVYPGDDGYHVTYTLNCMSRDTDSAAKGTHYSGPQIASSVVLQPGQPFTDSTPTKANDKAAGKAVTLTIATAAVEKPVQ
jgi:hypothetical protein